LAQNPNDVPAPACSTWFQDTPLAVTVLPLCDSVAFQDV
jgi:hypothetical protein